LIYSEIVGDLYHSELKELLEKHSDIIAISGVVRDIVLNDSKVQEEVNQFFLDCHVETVRVFFKRPARFYIEPGMDVYAIGRVYSDDTLVAHTILLPRLRQVLGLGRPWEWIAAFPALYVMFQLLQLVPFFNAFADIPELGFNALELMGYACIIGVFYAIYWVIFRKPSPVTCWTKTWYRLEQIVKDHHEFVSPDLRELYGYQSEGRRENA
jgi:hypothetical protein